MRWAVAAIVALAVAAGCSTEDTATGTTTTAGSGSSGTASTTAATGSTAPLPRLGLERVTEDLEEPTDAVPVVGGGLLVTEKAGRVRELVRSGDGYEVTGTVADVTDDVGSPSMEQGLLGVAADPGGEHMFTNRTRGDDGATVIERWTLSGKPGSRRAGDREELLVVDQPYPNHNGGDIVWGPDSMLWVGMGDGGAAGDPEGRAQDPDSLLGKMLRLDPSREDLVPPDNPWANGGGQPLVWFRGVRNPWRYAFDPTTTDLWVADVGQGEVEEVDLLTAATRWGRGADLEWDRREGNRDFEDAGPTDNWVDDGAPTVPPMYTYTHDDGGCSIVGGTVYRGAALPALDGRFVFSDYCDGRLRAVDAAGEAVDLGVSGDQVVSVNADEDGEVLVLDAGGIARLVAR